MDHADWQVRHELANHPRHHHSHRCVVDCYGICPRFCAAVAHSAAGVVVIFPFPDQFTIREADLVQHWRSFYSDSTIAAGAEYRLENRTKREIINFMARNPRPERKRA